MKKLFIILFIISFFPLFLFIYEILISEKVDEERKECYDKQTSECFVRLMDKYKFTSNLTKNILRYDYAYFLMFEKNYQKALEEFDYIIAHETINKELLSSSEEQKLKAEKILKEIEEQDIYSDYYKADKCCKWEKRNLNIYIDTDDEHKKDIVTKGFSIYTDSLGDLIKFRYVSNPKDADITVKFTDHFKNKSGNTDTKCLLDRETNKKHMQKANITIALKYYEKDVSHPDSVLLNITIHEIGHALGILNHSDSPNDMMYSTTNYRNDSLSQRDINTIKRIYKK